MSFLYKKYYLLLFIFLFLTGCTDNRTEIQKIIDSGELRFATSKNINNYLPVTGHDKGFEYELARKYANYLGVKLKIISVSDVNEIISMIRVGKATIGASGFINDYEIDDELIFGPEYYKVTHQIVYNYGGRRPEALDDIHYGDLNVSDKHQLHKLLLDIEQQNPQFSWHVHPDKNIEELLDEVNEDKITATVADSNTVSLYQHLYPNLRVAFDLTEPQSVSWIFKQHPDLTLQKSISEFFDYIKSNGELDELIERYFNHFTDFNYVDVRTFLQRVEDRLPEFEPYFKKAANKTKINWILLAAMSYQESHWDPSARSPTGVRGLMMLTQDTAEHVGIENRLDPEQSINGGAQYFTQTYEKIPERINEPDRTWLALAAYNIGYAHLEDARRLTAKRGGDPDRWIDVKETLPLLSDKEWYEQTQYGKARGQEPVYYVENIRRYFDILRWIKYPKKAQKHNQLLIRTLAIDSRAL